MLNRWIISVFAIMWFLPAPAQSTIIWGRINDHSTPLDSSLTMDFRRKQWELNYARLRDSMRMYSEAFSDYLGDYGGDDPDHIFAYSNFLAEYTHAHALCGLGYFEEGLPKYRQVLEETEQELGPIIDLSYAYVGLSQFYEAVGNFEQELYCHNQAIRVIDFELDPEDYGYYLMANKLCNAAQTYKRLGNKEKSIEYLDKGVEIYNSIEGFYEKEDVPPEKVELKYLEVYYYFQDYGKALSLARRLRHFTESLPDGYNRQFMGMETERYLGLIREGQARYQEAVKHFLTALDFGRHLGTRFNFSSREVFLTRAYQDISRSALYAEEYSLSRIYLDSARQVWLNHGTENDQTWHDLILLEANIENGIGNHGTAIEKYSSVLHLYGVSLNDILQANKSESTIPGNKRILAALRGILEGKYQQWLDEKDVDLRKEILTLSTIGQSQLTELMQTYVSDYSASVLLEEFDAFFKTPVLLLTSTYALSGNRKDLQHLFTLFERKRSARLLASYQSRDSQIRAGIPEELLNLEIEAKRKRDLYQAALNELLVDNIDNTALLREYQSLLQTYASQSDSIEQVYRQKYPKYHRLKYDTDPVSISQLQQRLTADDLLIEYYQQGDQLYVLGISQKDIQFRVLENNDQLEQLIRNFNLTCQQPPNQNQVEAVTVFARAGYSIYEQLLAPFLLEKTDYDRIILIPDGAISYLPWSALPTANSDARSFRNLPYLIREYDIVQEYSATIWALDQEATNTQYTYLGFAPEYAGSGGHHFRNGDSLRLARLFANTYRDGFSPLRYNVPEVEQVAQHYGAGQIFTRAEATEANYKSIAQEGKILHLAMHARTSDEDPMLSHLAFSPEPESDEDGTLFAYEIYNHPIPAELVVLSACNTGDGEYLNGQGVMSLARAFKYAGCRSVLMTQWQAHDLTTQNIIGQFFDQYATDQPAEQAIRQAQLQHLEQTENEVYTHPFYWAGFSLVGSEGFSKKKHSGKGWLYGLLGGMLLVLILRRSGIIGRG